MKLNYGFKDLFNSLNQVSNEDINTIISLLSVRVTDIILSDSHPLFKKLGGWQSIGYIEFEIINFQSGDLKIKPIAKPFFPNIKNYPLVNEIVLLFELSNNKIGVDTSNTSYYYISPINLWNHPHHNAYPNSFQISSNKINKSYKDIEGGSSEKVSNQNIGINLNSPKIGGTFEEKSNIRPLLPFNGDVIIEGRFGNSIRFGSTNKNKNEWSISGDNGNPITILSNGQNFLNLNEGWVPRTELINEDLSSIYLTSNQKLKIDIPGIKKGQSPFGNVVSKGQIPKSPISYNKPQIILNSDRILLNSKRDSIILSSKENIILSSVKDVGLSSTKNINLTANQVNLGGVNSSQSAILGDNFIINFKGLIKALENLCTALENEPNLGPTSLYATSFKGILKTINKNSNTFLSKKVKLL